MTEILSVAFALIFGLLFTRVTNKLKLPDVTAYLISGVLIGPYCLGALGIEGLGFTSAHSLEVLGFIANVALGFIAFAIGDEFRIENLKKTGKQAVVVAICEALCAVLVTFIALFTVYLIIGPEKLPLEVVITLSAIAAATAPAATLMVVKQYKAKGNVTSLLLPVVALDDAVCLIAFAVCFGIAKAVSGGTINLLSIVLEPILEIVLSLIMGAVLGFLLTQLEKLFHSNRNRTSLIIGFVLGTVGLSMLKFEIAGIHIGFSSLLVCMMLGSVFCNTCPLSEDLMVRSDKWTAPLIALFFILSGAELQLDVITDLTVIGIGLVYIIFRCVGKYLGAFGACAATKAPPEVKKYLGITLFPQAGVALGMCVTAVTLGESGYMIRNIVLFGVLIYEMFGPLMTKISLVKSGDIKHDEAISRREILLAKKDGEMK